MTRNQPATVAKPRAICLLGLDQRLKAGRGVKNPVSMLWSGLCRAITGSTVSGRKRREARKGREARTERNGLGVRAFSGLVWQWSIPLCLASLRDGRCADFGQAGFAQRAVDNHGDGDDGRKDGKNGEEGGKPLPGRGNGLSFVRKASH